MNAHRPRPREASVPPARAANSSKRPNAASTALGADQANLEQLQRRADHSAPVRHLNALQQTASRATTPTDGTGLPIALKRATERLSGYALDDVHVHYASHQPARRHAHAYAHGNDIHLASGQAHHLPHELWHVVQQKQGRVAATQRFADGTAINDQVSVEREADTMGQRALAAAAAASETPAPSQRIRSATPVPILQGVWYVRGLQNPGSMDYELQRLQSASPLATNNDFGGTVDQGYGPMPLDINEWMAGAAGLCTTRYNQGQNEYYSPVGFIVDVTAADVLGNYQGDGNTSTLRPHRAQYWQAFEAIRTAFLADANVHGEINAQGYQGDFNAPVTDLAQAGTLRGRVEAFLQDPAVADDVKQTARGLIRTAARAALVDHYQNNGFPAPLGPGNPAALAALEGHLQGLAPGGSYADPNQAGRAVRYTESVVHAHLANVVGAYYAAEPGQYPTLINGAWRTPDPNHLYNRATAANDFTGRFRRAGQDNANLMKLQGGTIARAGLVDAQHRIPPGFWPWAQAALGLAAAAALYYFPWSSLAPLVARFVSEGGGA